MFNHFTLHSLKNWHSTVRHGIVVDVVIIIIVIITFIK